MSNGARASARFIARINRALESTGLLSFRTLKRRERRAPQAAQVRYPFARDSIVARFGGPDVDRREARFVRDAVAARAASRTRCPPRAASAETTIAPG